MRLVGTILSGIVCMAVAACGAAPVAQGGVEAGDSSADAQRTTVFDGFWLVNTPVEYSGPPRTVEIESFARFEVRDGNVVSFSWDGVFSETILAQVVLPYSDGTFEISVTVADSAGNLLVWMAGRLPAGASLDAQYDAEDAVGRLENLATGVTTVDMSLYMHRLLP
jgi:hypothetical protein